MGTYNHHGANDQYGDEHGADQSKLEVSLLEFNLKRRRRFPPVPCCFNVRSCRLIRSCQIQNPHGDQSDAQATDPELKSLCHPLEKPHAAISSRLVMTPASFVVLARTQDYLGRSWAQRNPVFVFRSVGSHPIRTVGRILYDTSFHPPPRIIRCSPLDGPVGFRSGLLR